MTDQVAKYEGAGAAIAPHSNASFYFNTEKFDHGWRVASMFAGSSIVPENFRGKPENVMIALSMSQRLDIDPMMLMQNMYMVKGKPGISGQLAIAMINNCGMFGPLRFRFSGEGNSRECTAYAKDKNTGDELSQTVPWSMVVKEGWLGKSGSKWQSMPDMMFQYRAATFFARMYCPEALMGMSTEGEPEDIGQNKGMSADTTLPSSITSAVPPVEDEADKLQIFEESIPEDVGMDRLEKFLAVVAKNNDSNSTEVMEEAANNLEAFWKGYRKWETKNFPDIDCGA